MNLRYFFLLFSLGLSAQESTRIDTALQLLSKLKEDSLKVNHLNKISGYYTESDSAKAIFYSKAALSLSKKLNWSLGEAKSNFSLGATYSSHFKYDQAIAYFKKSLKNADEHLTSRIFQGLGGVYIYESKFSEALDCYFRALKIDERYKDQKAIAKISANIGSIYYGTHHYDKAIYYFNKAANTYQKLKNINDLAIVYRNIGSVYNSMNQMQKAVPYFEKSFELSKEINDTGLQARILSDLALTFYNLEQYQNAIRYSTFSLKTKNFQDKQVIAFNHGVIGDSYIELAAARKNNPSFLDSASAHLNTAIILHKELKSSRDLAYDYSSLTRSLKLKGDYKKALDSYEIAMIYEDSVFNFDNKETIKNLEDKRAIELRDREIKINKLKLEIKEKQKWILLCGLILLLIVGGMLWQKNIQRKKVNQKLKKLNDDLAKKNIELDQANKIKAFFFSILNHDLRSPVYQLIHFLQLKNEHPELLDDQQHIIEQKTKASAEHLVASMEDMLLWSKSQMEQFEPQAEQTSATNLFDEIKQSFSGYEQIEFCYENPEQISLCTDVNYLKTILRNLTANAVKVLETTKEPRIIWKAFRKENKIIFSITDNGPGAEKTQFKALYDDTEVIGIKSGLGLHVIRDLAKAIEAEIVVKSQIGQGTTIEIRI